MKEKHEILFDGKVYPVKEPTISMWSTLNNLSMFTDDLDVALELLSISTGLKVEELQQAPAVSVYTAAEALIEYYTKDTDRFVETFEFKDKTYKFIDLESMSFGQFIDIDDILSKSEGERNTKLHILMALLYTELNEDGEPVEYDIKNIKRTAEIFKDLPLKYLGGAMVFFSIIVNILQGNTRFSLTQRTWWIWRIHQISKGIKTLSDGITSWFNSQGRTPSKLKRWFDSITSKRSTS